MDRVSFDAAQHFAAAQATPSAPAFLPPMEGLIQLWVFGVLVTLNVSGNETMGAFAMHQSLVSPGSKGPLPHRHTREEEYFYVTEGEFTLLLDGKEIHAPKDSFVHVRRGVFHGFENRSNKCARMLVMYTPTQFQQWFLKVGIPADGASENSFPGPALNREDYDSAIHWMEEFGLDLTPPPTEDGRGHE